MAVDGRLLEILCCPVTEVPVRRLAKDKLASLNASVKRGEVRYLDGASVDDELSEALITENGTSVYRVDDGIPIMLEEMGIPTSQLDNF